MAWKMRSKAGHSSGKSVAFSVFGQIQTSNSQILLSHYYFIQSPKLILLKEMAWKKRSKAGDSSGKSVAFSVFGQIQTSKSQILLSHYYFNSVSEIDPLERNGVKKRPKAGDSSGKSVVFSTFRPLIQIFCCRNTILIQCPKLILLKEMVWKKRSKVGHSSGKSVVFSVFGHIQTPNSEILLSRYYFNSVSQIDPLKEIGSKNRSKVGHISCKSVAFSVFRYLFWWKFWRIRTFFELDELIQLAKNWPVGHRLLRKTDPIVEGTANRKDIINKFEQTSSA